MTATRLRLASVLVVVARWSTDLDVIFIISGVLYWSKLQKTTTIGDPNSENHHHSFFSFKKTATFVLIVFK